MKITVIEIRHEYKDTSDDKFSICFLHTFHNMIFYNKSLKKLKITRTTITK